MRENLVEILCEPLLPTIVHSSYLTPPLLFDSSVIIETRKTGFTFGVMSEHPNDSQSSLAESMVSALEFISSPEQDVCLQFPRLESVNRKAMMRFLNERWHIIEALRDIVSRPDEPFIPSLKASIDKDILISLIVNGEFPDDVLCINDISEEALQDWFGDVAESCMKDVDLNQLRQELLKKVFWNMEECDVCMRVNQLFKDYAFFLRSKGVEVYAMVHYSDAFDQIVGLVSDTRLQERICRDRTSALLKSRKEWRGFSDRIKFIAKLG